MNARGERVNLLVYDRRLRLMQTVPVVPPSNDPSVFESMIPSLAADPSASDSVFSAAPNDFLASVFCVADSLLVVTQTVVNTSDQTFRTKELTVSSVPSVASGSGALASRTVSLRPWTRGHLSMRAGFGRLLVGSQCGRLYCFARCGAMLWLEDLSARLRSPGLRGCSATVYRDEAANYVVCSNSDPYDDTQEWATVLRLSFDEPRHQAVRWRPVRA
eukprot:TRINITY_DN6527_c0_g1_i1.p1 TRINITY_DN6527_c0_g1~~TRINITY_DN6527_c0_g1_i1.p1  ORF type:complete len:217 (+),score=27.54 TRINITY_DN6527_c0_g1_i1:387-1037(+)